jgi:hypothetical protein
LPRFQIICRKEGWSFYMKIQQLLLLYLYEKK